MWPNTRVTEILQIEYPILQAPMAGGATTPELVAAVSNAGGLGSLGAGYMPPEQIRTAIRAIRKLTDRQFAVNLFVPETIPDADDQIRKMNDIMRPFRSELGIDTLPSITGYAESFEDQLAVILEEKVPVFSFTFGIPPEETLRALKAENITIIGTATTVREALELEANGVDLIVGQGSEAGGHRGTFLCTHERALVGTMALIPQLADHLRIPVVAAGGIMDGRGIAAALALGAEGVQIGTVFLTCPESGAHEKYKEALLNSTEEDTVITRAFSGKPARGIRNRFIVEMEAHVDHLPAYPIQNALTRDIRQAAAKQNKTDFMSLWAGQGSRMCRTITAGELVAELADQVTRVMERLK